MTEKSIVLAELPFTSLQGEGFTVGRLSLFIRFSGCCFHCEFCDSKFSWTKGPDTVNYTISELVDIIKNAKVNDIVFTGGEPLLYQEAISNIIAELNYEEFCGKIIEIETTGMVELTPNFISSLDSFSDYSGAKILFNISPKIEFLNDKTYPIFYGNIMKLNKSSNISYILKFVDIESQREDIHNIANILINSNYELIDRSDVYIMPECVTREEHLARFESTLDFCKENGFNMSPRAHILLWDKRRAV